MFDFFLCKTCHFPCLGLPKIKSETPTVVIEPLSERVDIARVTEFSKKGFQLVVNSAGVVLTGYSKKVSDLFGVKVQKLIGKVLGNNDGRPIIRTISELIKKVVNTGKPTGCIVSVCRGDQTEKYIMIGMPIVCDDGLYSFYICKKPMEDVIELSDKFTSI